MNCRTCTGPCCLKGSNIEGDCEGYKPLSHYDQIRSMSVEEMAEYHAEKCGCPHDPIVFGCRMATIGCIGCWLDWLRQEAEHE